MMSYKFFFSIRPPPGLLPVSGLLEQYMTPTLDSALLCSSRAGSDLGRVSGLVCEALSIGFPHSQIFIANKATVTKHH